MPIYEYRCDSCGHTFEKIVRSHGAPPPECPSCGAAQVNKLVSAPNFQLKGSGWYKDHYGLKPAASAETGKGSGVAASSDGGAKAEAKPATGGGAKKAAAAGDA